MERQPQHTQSHRPGGSGDAPKGGVLSWITEVYCGLHGHDNLLHFEADRMFLRCASCGHETPGWELTETAPTVRLQGDRRRHMLIQPPLVTSRRVA